MSNYRLGDIITLFEKVTFGLYIAPEHPNRNWITQMNESYFIYSGMELNIL